MKKQINVLIIDPHRSEFFWEPIANALAKETGFAVRIAKAPPFDLYRFDVIINVYLNELLRDLSHNTTDMPIIGVCMGTDACVQSYTGTNSKRIKTVIAFNTNHQNLIKPDFKFSDHVLLDWPADDSRLFFQNRKPLTVTEGQPSTLRLLNIALHQYSKGLDNLIQQLADVSEDFPHKIELHVIGSMGPFRDYNQYLNYYVQWFTSHKLDKSKFDFIYHGEQHPYKIDDYIESIAPNAYIASSQGEQGATSVSEGLIKGFNVFVQEHPFADGLYTEFVVHAGEGENRRSINDPERASKKGLHYYNTARDLGAQLKGFLDNPADSATTREYGMGKFRMGKFIEGLVSVLRGAVK